MGAGRSRLGRDNEPDTREPRAGEGDVQPSQRVGSDSTSSLDRPEQAIHHFESSIELCAKMQARVHLTRSEFELARVLEQFGELNRAQNLRESALASARELGMFLAP